MSTDKIECVRCQERKESRFFVSPWLAIRCCVEANTYLTPPNEHKSSQPVVLCQSCLRILAMKIAKKWYNRKPKNRLCNNVRQGIRKSFRTGRGGLWESRVGYTFAELRRHLHNRFKPGMSWSNYGCNDGQWQIDHIKPVCSFDFSSYDDKDFKCCWSLSNLRPLWARDNWANSRLLPESLSR